MGSLTVIALDDALADVTTLGCDTPLIIYLIEMHPKYDALVTEIFRRIEQGIITGFTSAITLTEVLTQPLKQGQIHLQKEYRDLLLHSANFSMLPVNVEIAEQAAVLRAQYGLRTPDALQVAVAKTANCQVFLTNDKDLKRVEDMKVLVLDELAFKQEDEADKGMVDV